MNAGKKSRRINEEVSIEKWKRYFRELLDGVEWKVIRGHRTVV